MVNQMARMVLARTLSMLIATVCSSLVALEIYAVGHVVWPLYWFAGEIVLVILRIDLIRRARNEWKAYDWAILPYVVSGLAWSLMIGIAACLSALSRQPIIVLLAAVVVMGLIGAITARNSPIPRTAVTQLLLVSLPYLAGIFWAFESWEAPLALMVIVAVIGMISLAEHLHNQVVHLITAERENAYMAHHDVLTGLLNRAGFQKQLQALTARQQAAGASDAEMRFALLCLDLDGFKGINDTLGHAAGDAVLRSVADRLKDLVTGKDLAARLSGDEFVVLLPGKDALMAQELAGRVIDRISQPFDFGAAWPVRVNTSIGIACAPIHGTDAALLLARADAALYAAKAAGKGVCRIFQSGLDHTDLLAELREALTVDGQLILYYQPVINVMTGKITGREALLRWDHPKMGLLPPDEFIPAAERSRLMVPLGAKVIAMACEAALGWPDQARVSVNVSSRQLGERGLVEAVLAALERTGLPPSRLELEIVESAPILRTGRVLADLTALRNLGVQIALDDFPSGYSTLAALDWFQFDRIKLDGATIDAATRKRQSTAILRASAELARELGMQITAEGIETEHHLSVARRLNVDELQGFLFGRPKPEVTVLPGHLLPQTQGQSPSASPILPSAARQS